MSPVDRRTQWRGQPDTLRWRFVGLLGLSLALHSALTPWAAFLGLLGLLGAADPAEARDLPPITAIPIEILEEEPTPDPSEGAKQQAGDPDATTLSEPPSEVASEPPEPEGVEPAPEAQAEVPEDTEGAGQEPEPEAMGDPVALSGSAGKLADSNANVRIKVDTEKVRQHALGPRIGEVLGRVPQWHDFLGPAKLDPIRDIDRLLIAGPQLRDSSEVIAVLRYNVERPAMEAAIDNLVQRSSGEWLDGPTRAATARADRAERIFSFIAPNLLAIVPPSARADALKPWPKGASFPPIPGDAVLTAFVLTPHQVYIGLPFRFPETVQWIRATITPDAAGGAVARIEAEEGSEEAATSTARWLERRVRSLTAPQGLAAAAAKFLYGGDKFVETVEFSAEGTRVTGTLRATASQMNIILTLVEGIVNSWNPRPAPPAASAPAASQSAPPGGTLPLPIPPRSGPAAAPTFPPTPAPSGRAPPPAPAPP